MKKYKVSAPFIILPFMDIPASNEQEALDNYNLVVKELLNRHFGTIDVLPYQEVKGSVEIIPLE